MPELGIRERPRASHYNAGHIQRSRPLELMQSRIFPERADFERCLPCRVNGVRVEEDLRFGFAFMPETWDKALRVPLSR